VCVMMICCCHDAPHLPAATDTAPPAHPRQLQGSSLLQALCCQCCWHRYPVCCPCCCCWGCDLLTCWQSSPSKWQEVQSWAAPTALLAARPQHNRHVPATAGLACHCCCCSGAGWGQCQCGFQSLLLLLL
jgi:hypothetical protein